MAEQDEIKRLKMELDRAYRCISGFYTAHQKSGARPDTAMAYHSPTIAAARRHVLSRDYSLEPHEAPIEGAEYFIGKHVDVMSNWLAENPVR